MKQKYEHIYFEEGYTNWFCFNNRTKDCLGVVEWYAAWGKWVFSSKDEDVLFSHGCLDDISHFMKQLVPRK